MPTAEQTEFKAYLDKHGVEEAMSVAVDRLMKMKERPPDPVAAIGRILCEIGATATKPEDNEAQAALRTKVGTVLAPLKEASSAAATTHKHALPEALQKFVTPDLAAGPLGPREAQGQGPARVDEAVGGAGPQGLCAADRGLRRTQPHRNHGCKGM